MPTLGVRTGRLDLRRFEAPSTARSVLQLHTTVGPLGLVWWLTAELLHRSWLLAGVLTLVGTGLRVRAMLFQHDCGHGAFLRTRRANDVLGLWLGILGWTPFFYWQRTHALHHVNSSRMEGREELGSIMTLTVGEYEALPPARRRLYRLYRHPLFLCAVGGPLQFLLKHRFPWDTPRRWRREWASVLFTNVGLGAVLWLLSLRYGWGTVLAVELPVVALASMVAVWLIYIQHVFPGGYFAEGPQWTLEEASVRGSSYYLLPGILRWCTADVGLHHVHHYSPKIPNYRLKECLDATPELQVPPLTLRGSLECWKLKLWDERSQQFVGFPEADGHLVGAAQSRTG